MIVELTTTSVELLPEINAVNLVITPTFTSGAGGGDVTKAYVDQQDALKVDKVAGKSLISDTEITRLATITNYDDTAIVQELVNKVDEEVGKSLIADTEIEKLADYPTLDPIDGNSSKFINERGEIVEISIGGGGSPVNIYASNVDSIAAGYKTANIVNDAAETIKTITAVSNNVIAWGEKYLYVAQVVVTQIPQGFWYAHLFGKVNSTQGISMAVMRVFLVSSLGVETEVVAPFYSLEIDETATNSQIEFKYAAPAINCLATDFVGIQIGFVTDSVSPAKTFTYTIGDGYASHINTPLNARHDSLRDLNGNPNFQHVTTTEKNAWNGAVTEIPAAVGAFTYPLEFEKPVVITGTLPNGVNSTLTLPTLISAKTNQCILHFKTNAVAAPTFVYSGFTPVWLNGKALALETNKVFTIIFEQLNGIVKASWGKW